MSRTVLVVNAGSTSLKLNVVEEDGQTEPVASLAELDADRVDLVAHRVVHGGARFVDPVLIDAAVRDQIAELTPIAPLHNAPALEGIDAAMAALPDRPHVAVFDTAFHATIPAEASTYALPARWRAEWGVRRFGFHGLSVAWAAERAAELLPPPAAAADPLRLVVCHLGGGSSITAVRDGCSVDTTMGFSPLEGVPMTTRSGSIDPGALLYVMREHKVEPRELDRVLNHESGLAALSGTSGDMRELERLAEQGDQSAQLAVDVYVHRVAGAAGAMATAAGGLDGLVFTAGIGEGSALVRREVCARLRHLGVELDDDRNRLGAPDASISAPSSPAAALVIAAREELVAARLARALLPV